MQTNYATQSCGIAAPSAYITTKRSRVKQFNDTVYLKDGDEFQLEIFNPKENKVLAKIFMNGVSISSSGLVIKPGQRIFLDRFIDNNDKFKFETYSVNGSNDQVKKAIQNNGSVEVQFFDEYIPPYVSYNSLTINCNNTGGNLFRYNTTTGNSLLTSNGNIGFSTASFNASNSNSATFTSSASLNNAESIKRSFFEKPKEKEVETGRIEKGGKSDQSFGTDYSNYSAFYTTTVKWKILPLSVKPVQPLSDIKEYCISCGYRNRRHNYCPRCGSKF